MGKILLLYALLRSKLYIILCIAYYVVPSVNTNPKCSLLVYELLFSSTRSLVERCDLLAIGLTETHKELSIYPVKHLK